MKQDFLIDSFGRRISYLRISLTEACNFKCVYCLPSGGILSSPSGRYLKLDEIARFVALAAGLGIEKVRLTGGEPLLRPDIVEIVRALKQIDGIRDLSITTNGSRLELFLKPLREAGLDRINISLDSIDPERFRRITGSRNSGAVLGAALSALRAGFPVKINAVALRGLNEDELLGMGRLAEGNALEVRFLEFMPLCGENWSPEYFLPISEVRALMDRHFDLVEEVGGEDDTARVFRIRGGAGKIGFIASLTESFCDRCSRVRMTADGKIRPCLFSEEEYAVGHLLRAGAPDEEIRAALRLAVKMKPKGNEFRGNPYRADSRFGVAAGEYPLIHKVGG
ncbi:MAG: GTP 3',8-cyclase MoaA [Candidatus Omnitrophica bacterium]|nr:GTP 3',8-cyclase MoaA [Candidatus Omnitrophota bacterium]